MKQEVKEGIERGTLAVVGTGATLTINEINAIVGLFVGVVTFLYVTTQLFFLLRKWYRLEKVNWKPSIQTDTDRTDL
jgi:hypothetical protein